MVVAIVSRLLLLLIFFLVIVVTIIVRKLVLLLERTWMEVELAIFAVLGLEHGTARIRVSLLSHWWLLSHCYWRHSLVELLQL